MVMFGDTVGMPVRGPETVLKFGMAWVLSDYRRRQGADEGGLRLFLEQRQMWRG